jgi:hypothetical protein
MNLLFKCRSKLNLALTIEPAAHVSVLAGSLRQLPFGKALDAELRGIDQIRVAGIIWFSSPWC